MTDIKMKTRTVVITEVEYIFITEALSEYSKCKAIMGKMGLLKEPDAKVISHLSVLVGFMEKIDEVFGAERTPMTPQMREMVEEVRKTQTIMSEVKGEDVEPN